MSDDRIWWCGECATRFDMQAIVAVASKPPHRPLCPDCALPLEQKFIPGMGELKEGQIAFGTGAEGHQAFIKFSIPTHMLYLSPEAAIQLGRNLIVHGHAAGARRDMETAEAQGEAHQSVKH